VALNVRKPLIGLKISRILKERLGAKATQIIEKSIGRTIHENWMLVSYVAYVFWNEIVENRHSVQSLRRLLTGV
jgi:hypothetical protein